MAPFRDYKKLSGLVKPCPGSENKNKEMKVI